MEPLSSANQTRVVTFSQTARFGQVVTTNSSVTVKITPWTLSTTNDLLEYLKFLEMYYHDMTVFPTLLVDAPKSNQDAPKSKQKLFNTILEYMHTEGNGRIHYGNMEVLLHTMLLGMDCNTMSFTAMNQSIEIIDTIQTHLKDVINDDTEKIVKVISMTLDSITNLMRCGSKLLQGNDYIKVLMKNLYFKAGDLLYFYQDFIHAANSHSVLSRPHSKSAVVLVDPFAKSGILKLEQRPLSVYLNETKTKNLLSNLQYDRIITVYAHTTDFPTLVEEGTVSRPIRIENPPVLVQARERSFGVVITDFIEPGIFNIEFPNVTFGKNHQKRQLLNVPLYPDDTKTKLRDSACRILQIKPSLSFATILTVASKSKLKIKSAKVMVEKDIGLLEVTEHATADILGDEGFIFLDQSTEREHYEHRGHSHFILLGLVQDQPWTRNQTQEDEIEVLCEQVSCVAYDFKEYSWKQSLCRVGNITKQSSVRCLCERGSLFSAGIGLCDFTVLDINQIEVDQITCETVWKKLTTLALLDNMIVLVILILLICLLMALMWASKRDRLFSKLIHQKVLMAPGIFSPLCKEHYLVCLMTGYWRPFNTSSEVSIILLGKRNHEKRIDIPSPDFFYTAGSETWVLVSSPYSFHQITEIVLFVNGKGAQPNWFCSGVYIRSLSSGKNMYCDVDSWLQAEGSKKYVIKEVKDTYDQNRMLQKIFIDLLRGFHILISILFGLERLHHTRVKHVLCVFLTIFTIMTTVVVVFGTPVYKVIPSILESSTKVVLLPIHMFFGFSTACIAAVLCPILSWIIIRSRPMNVQDLGWYPPHVYGEEREKCQEVEEKFEHWQNDHTNLPNDLENWPVDLAALQNEYMSLPKSEIPPSASAVGFKTVMGYSIKKTFASKMFQNASENISQNISQLEFTTQDKTNNSNNILSSPTRVTKDYSVVSESAQGQRIGQTGKHFERSRKKSGGFCKRWFYYEPVAYCFFVGLLLMELYVLLICGLFYSDKARAEFLCICGIAFVFFTFLIQPLVLLIVATIKVHMKDLYLVNYANHISEVWFSQMHTVVEDSAQGKTLLSRNVGLDRVPLSAKFKEISRRIVKRHTKKGSSSQASGKSQILAVLTLTLILVTLILNYVQVSPIKERYMQTAHIRKTLMIGLENVPLDKSFTVEEVWHNIKHRFYDRFKTSVYSLSNTDNLRALSKIRIRQLRHMKYTGDCAADNPRLKEPKCHEPYSDGPIETNNFIQTWNYSLDRNAETIAGPYTYTESKWYEFSDFNLFCSQFGYFQHGGYDSLVAVAIVDPPVFDYFVDSEWLDEWTKLIRIDMTIFNVDTGLATAVTVAYEFTPWGIFQDSTVLTFQLVDKINRQTRLIICLAVFSITVIFVVAGEFVQIYNKGIKKYFAVWTNIFSIFELFICFLIVAMFGLIETLREVKLQEIREIRFKKEEEYVEFSSFAMFEQFVNYLCAIVGLVQLVKLFVTYRVIPMSDIFAKLVDQMKGALLGPVFATFQLGMFGYMLFLGQKFYFSSLPSSMIFVLLLVFNPLVYVTTFLTGTDNRWFGNIYFILTAFVMKYIFINLFIAIINLSFSYFKKHTKATSKGKLYGSNLKTPIKRNRRTKKSPESSGQVPYAKQFRNSFYVFSHGQSGLSENFDEVSRSLSESNEDNDIGFENKV